MSDFEKKYEPEVNWKRVLKGPTKFVALTYFVVLAMIVGGGASYVQNFDEIFERKYAPLPKTNKNESEKDIAMKKASMTGGIDLQNAIKSSADKIEKGKQLFATTCAVCHGTDGKADGPTAQAMNPKPRNFTALEGWTNGRRFMDMYKTLSEGIADRGMVSYEYLSVEDRFALIHYIRTIADYPAVDDKELADFDTKYKLSEGDFQPANIPVSLALTKLVEENKKDMDNILSHISDYVKNYENKQAAKLFNMAALNEKKVITTLQRNSAWKTDVNKLIEICTSNLIDNGFCAVSANFTAQEWNTLHSFLLEIDQKFLI